MYDVFKQKKGMDFNPYPKHQSVISKSENGAKYFILRLKVVYCFSYFIRYIC